MNKKKYLIIYHKEDADGLVSASIIFNNIIGYDNISDLNIHKIESNIINIDNFLNCNINIKQYKDNNVTVDLFGTYYGQLSNILNIYKVNELVDILYNKYDQIIMTDISFNETNVMKSIYNKFKLNFSWFDHHGPVIKASLNENFNCVSGIRDTSTSAIGLVYSYFEYKDKDILTCFEDKIQKCMPAFLQQLAGYDSFNWKFHNQEFDVCYNMTKGFEFVTKLDIIKCIIFIRNFFINLYGYDENDIQAQIIDCYNKGKEINEYEEEHWNKIIKDYGDDTFVIDGKYGPERKTLVLVTQGKTCSTVFKSLINTDIKNVVVFKRLKEQNDNKTWTASVYNIRREDDEEFNVGMYLKKRYKYAGGHRGCGGVSLSNTQFNKIFKTHKI